LSLLLLFCSGGSPDNIGYMRFSTNAVFPGCMQPRHFVRRCISRVYTAPPFRHPPYVLERTNHCSSNRASQTRNPLLLYLVDSIISMPNGSKDRWRFNQYRTSPNAARNARNASFGKAFVIPSATCFDVSTYCNLMSSLPIFSLIHLSCMSKCLERA